MQEALKSYIDAQDNLKEKESQAYADGKISEEEQRAIQDAQAKTSYEVINQNDKYSLCKVHLHTGRTHQIRVHFQH
ncbi:pseudouridine synthase, partial [Staphylococcus aureus]|uniref:pseudouridine synthase n=1 Tax=Staphylococcus aureus TaxID=1280 RepID=UPI00351E4857